LQGPVRVQKLGTAQADFRVSFEKIGERSENIRRNNDIGIADDMVPASDGGQRQIMAMPETDIGVVPYRAYPVMPVGIPFDNFPSAIRGMIIHHDQVARDSALKMLDKRGQSGIDGPVIVEGYDR
jgi:hypothetical protein